MLQKETKITKQVYNRICKTIGTRSIESGGMLGSSDGGKTINHYYFDQTAKTTGSTYSPNTAVLNNKIDEWNDSGIEFVGMIHSHPRGFTVPSDGDIEYTKAIVEAVDFSGNFLMIIVNVSDPPDGIIKMYSYMFDENQQYHEQPFVIVDDITETVTKKNIEKRFDRIKTLYPLDILNRKTVVHIGAGGTRAFVEELARSGITNHIIIEGDTVEATNIATQQVYISEIGRNKADVLKERILDINPSANVKVIPQFLDDSISDRDFENIVGKNLFVSPKDVLICACTDSFHAQARSAALALKYASPFLAGQLYRRGMAAEIYFNYPGVTTGGCQCCVMNNRYKAYKEGYTNDVTSDGTPIFATTRVNSTKGQIALMLLLYGEDETCVYNRMLDEVVDRNFVMIRMNPLANSVLKTDVFKNAVYVDDSMSFFDETLWIPQTPNNGKNGYEKCPVCGGVDNLLELKSKNRDTRILW